MQNSWMSGPGCSRHVLQQYIHSFFWCTLVLNLIRSAIRVARVAGEQHWAFLESVYLQTFATKNIFFYKWVVFGCNCAGAFQKQALRWPENNLHNRALSNQLVHICRSRKSLFDSVAAEKNWGLKIVSDKSVRWFWIWGGCTLSSDSVTSLHQLSSS